MPAIPVTRSFSAQPLFPISDPTFATWYGHGLWWALYGDYQGTGQYEDTYLIDNISRNLQAGRYDSPSSSELPPSGFYVGVHGGMLEPGSHRVRASASIVILTDPDFTGGYHDGRRCPQPLTDCIFTQHLHQWATQRLNGQALAHELGRLAGALHLALLSREPQPCRP